MKKQKKITLIGTLILCLPLCGAWTTAQAETPEEVYYPNQSLVSTRAVEYIEYNTKTIVEDLETDMAAPHFYCIGGLENACGAVAGATAVSFYDKYYSNMITGWDSYYANGRYRIQDTTYIPALQRDLYSRMKINVTYEGVTESNFKTGLSNYIKDQGYSVSYDSVWSGGTFNYSAFKTAVNNNKITVLFVKPSNLYVLADNADVDVLGDNYIPANHIMVAFGYYEVKYTTSSGTRTDKYLKVSSGFDGIGLMLYKVGSYIDAAYTLQIS